MASRQATLQQAKSQFAVQLQLMTSAREAAAAAVVVVSFNPLIDAVVVVVVVVVRRGHSVDTLWTHTHTHSGTVAHSMKFAILQFNFPPSSSRPSSPSLPSPLHSFLSRAIN